MRIITRQQDTLINTINSMQQQNENLYSLISDLIRIQNETATTRTTTTRQQPRTYASTNRTRRTTINRPRTRMFFPSTLSGITERINRTPRIVTHAPSMRVNIPGTVNQNTTTEDILNESFNSYNPISIRPSLFQIRRATRILEFRDISNTTHQICPIDREILNPSDTVMQILHCNHYFRESNLRRHFRNNTRCPLCRFDIRNYIPSLAETSPLLSSRPSIPPPPPPINLPPTRRTMPPPPPPPPLPEDDDDDFSFNDIENPFETRHSANINPSQQSTQEIQELLGRAIENAINSDSSGNNVLAFEYSVSIGTNPDNTTNE
tara:strand:+ start:388 stop:1350 length:963 start_codon:yes stop_codon:yes gene_type:complete